MTFLQRIIFFRIATYVPRIPDATEIAVRSFFNEDSVTVKQSLEYYFLQ